MSIFSLFHWLVSEAHFFSGLLKKMVYPQPTLSCLLSQFGSPWGYLREVVLDSWTATTRAPVLPLKRPRAKRSRQDILTLETLHAKGQVREGAHHRAWVSLGNMLTGQEIGGSHEKRCPYLFLESSLATTEEALPFCDKEWTQKRWGTRKKKSL